MIVNDIFLQSHPDLRLPLWHYQDANMAVSTKYVNDQCHSVVIYISNVLDIEGWFWTQKAKHVASSAQSSRYARPQEAGHL